jgi:hypothetical protein
VSHAKAYPPPTPTKQLASPWRVDENGNLSREVRAVEIEVVDPRAELARLRIRLAGSESAKALLAVRAAADDLAERVSDTDLRKDLVGLIERVSAKLMRAQVP